MTIEEKRLKVKVELMEKRHVQHVKKMQATIDNQRHDITQLRLDLSKSRRFAASLRRKLRLDLSKSRRFAASLRRTINNMINN